MTIEYNIPDQSYFVPCSHGHQLRKIKKQMDKLRANLEIKFLSKRMKIEALEENVGDIMATVERAFLECMKKGKTRCRISDDFLACI